MKMNDFKLDSRLVKDGILLGELELSLLLLMNNNLVPWFILVPQVAETEFYRLSRTQQSSLLHEINQVSRFIQEAFSPDKLNVASIGNIVSQMHIHIVGRTRDDFCWPQVVWGRPERKPYREPQIERLRDRLSHSLQRQFKPIPRECSR